MICCTTLSLQSGSRTLGTRACALACYITVANIHMRACQKRRMTTSACARRNMVYEQSNSRFSQSTFEREREIVLLDGARALVARFSRAVTPPAAGAQKLHFAGSRSAATYFWREELQSKTSIAWPSQRRDDLASMCARESLEYLQQFVSIYIYICIYMLICFNQSSQMLQTN